MNDEDGRRIAALLEEIRDGQREQIARQAEALALQREQFALVQRQFERTDKLQDRAETWRPWRAYSVIQLWKDSMNAPKPKAAA